MPSKGKSKSGRQSMDGGKQFGFQEPPRIPDSDVKLIENMTKILDILIRDNVENKRRTVREEASKLQMKKDELVQRHEENEIEIAALQDQLDGTTTLTSEDENKIKLTRNQTKTQQKTWKKMMETASRIFNSEVANIKEYLEKKGFHDLDSKLYTSDEIKAAAERLNKTH